MTTIRNLLTGAVLGLAALSAFAAPSAAERLDAFLTKTQEGAGTFEQRVVTKEGEEAAPAARGSFQFKRPGQFLWRYEEPYRQLIVSNGETLWFYDEDLAQVTTLDFRSFEGKSVPASVFEWAPPEGVDVLDMGTP